MNKMPTHLEQLIAVMGSGLTDDDLAGIETTGQVLISLMMELDQHAGHGDECKIYDELTATLLQQAAVVCAEILVGAARRAALTPAELARLTEQRQRHAARQQEHPS